MPGVVEDYVRGLEVVEQTAAEHDQRWDIKAALRENLRDIRVAFPQESVYESVQHAITYTQSEIKDAAEIQAFGQGYKATRARLDERYFNASTSHGWDVSMGKSQPWTNAEERELVQRISSSENRFIAKSQFETHGGRYAADEPYRHGAREAVIQFSRDNNHRLLQAEREREAPHQRMRVG
jgi:hypothetical protein